jgi:UDP-2,4-diacetamido-2,4,6-trideoxy-beta-L-altropyranose hydrolase
MSEKRLVAIRCDASIQVGSGHVMRCLTLANELGDRGAEVSFICREHPGNLFVQIEAAGFRLFRLPFAEASDSKLAHASWLGETQAVDARQTAAALQELGEVDWLIVDHYALDAEWESAMRAYAKQIMVIDDLADRKHDCDVLLDQNFYKDMDVRYEGLLPPHCRKLLGPKYALLRPEFREARSKLRERDGSIRRVFVFFGGSDPTNETGKALRAIQSLGRTDIAVDVVVGAGNPHLEEIARLCEAMPQAALHRQISNMAELMANADLAVGAGGSTSWERCCLGLPTIVVSIAENQHMIAKNLAVTGAIGYLGASRAVTVNRVSEEMGRLSSSPECLLAMSQSGLAIVDGAGVSRVTRQLGV